MQLLPVKNLTPSLYQMSSHCVGIISKKKRSDGGQIFFKNHSQVEKLS